MLETTRELAQLQELLDASLSRSSGHLRSIVEGRSVRAEQLVRLLTGVQTLALSTVTAGGEPRVSGADGHFLHGSWHFGTARTAAKVRHLAARPAASVAHLRGDDLGVFAHGTAEVLNPAHGAPDPGWPEVLAHLKGCYGEDAFDWEREVVYYRLRAHWLTAYAPDVERLLTGS